MFKGKYILPLFIIALAVILLPDISAIAEAADKVAAPLENSFDNEQIGKGVGLEKFDAGFTPFVKDILRIMRPLVSIMTVVAGLQIAFGISDGKKTIWNWILGAGLAISFADFVYSSSVFGTFISGDNNTYSNDMSKFPTEITNNPEDNSNFLSKFMEEYREGIIFKGAAAIKGVCVKLLLILFTINCSMKLALDLISGDKIKFLISETLKAGFYIFLITNWVGSEGMNLTGLLNTGFQELGFMAGGNSPSASNPLSPDSIWDNGLTLLNAMLILITEKAKSFDIANTLFMVVVFVVACYCILMISIEMFMVQIEFFTMALLSMPLLAFAMIEQFNFLATKAIGAVFNLALKCCVIAFIQAVSVPYFTTMIEKITETKTHTSYGVGGVAYDVIVLREEYFKSVGESFMAFLTIILGLFVILMLTKKIPELVSGLLNGNPSLGATSMTSIAMGAVGGMATTAGVLSNMPGGGSGGGGGKGGDNKSNEGTPLNELKNTAKDATVGYAMGGPAGALKAAAEHGVKNLTQQEGQDGAQPGGPEATPQGSQGSTQYGGQESAPDSAAGDAATMSEPPSGDVEDSAATPDQTVGDGDTGTSDGDAATDTEGAGDQTATADNASSPPSPAPQSIGSSRRPSGGGVTSQGQPSRGSSIGGAASYLAKAAIMASPAGNIVRAYQHGKNLTAPLDSGSEQDLATQRHAQVMQAQAESNRRQEEAARLQAEANQRMEAQNAAIYQHLDALIQQRYNNNNQQQNQNNNDRDHE